MRERLDRARALEQVLEFCAREPVERVFLEDVARRGLGRFVARRGRRRRARGALPRRREPRPVRRRLRGVRRRRGRAAASRMIIGEERAVERALGGGRRRACRRRARTGRASPSTRSPSRRPSRARRGCAPATLDDLEPLVPACAAAHEVELGVDPLARDAEGFRWRTRAQIEEGRSWLWLEDGVILLQGRGVGLDAGARCRSSRSGSTPRRAARGYGARGLRDLCRLLLEHDADRDALRPHRERAGDRALRVDRDAARRHATAASSSRDATAILARHGESEFSVRGLLNGDIAVAGRADAGRASSRRGALGEALRDEPLDLCVTSEFERAGETADVALRGPRRAAARRAGAERPALRPLRGRLARGLPRVGRRRRRRRRCPATAARAGTRSSSATPRALPASCSSGRRRRSSSSRHSLPVAYALGARDGDAARARGCRSSSTRRRIAFTRRRARAAVTACSRRWARGSDLVSATTVRVVDASSSGSRSTSARTS